jgi:endonuclease III
MKNATAYEKGIRKFIAGCGKAKPIVPQDPFHFIVEAILQADASRKAAAHVLHTINREFVDYNELRVAPIKDITDCMGRDFPFARLKAEAIVKSINCMFDHTCSLSIEYMQKMPKRDLRKHLREAGLSYYATALVLMVLFAGHAVPVDHSLAILLEQDGYVNPGSSLEDVQGFLERVITQKEGLAVHEFFRDYVEKNAKSIAKRLKEEAAAAVEAAAAEAAAAALATVIIPAVPLVDVEEELAVEDLVDEDEDAPVAPVLTGKAAALADKLAAADKGRAKSAGKPAKSVKAPPKSKSAGKKKK